MQKNPPSTSVGRRTCQYSFWPLLVGFCLHRHLKLSLAWYIYQSPSTQLRSVCRPQSKPSVMTNDVGVLVAAIVQCMKSSAQAADLSSLMDQLAHVLVITHNTSPDPFGHPTIHLHTRLPMNIVIYIHSQEPIHLTLGLPDKASSIWRLTWEHVWWKICQDGHEPCSNSLAALACLFQCWPICKLYDCRWLLFWIPLMGNDFFIFSYRMTLIYWQLIKLPAVFLLVIDHYMVLLKMPIYNYSYRVVQYKNKSSQAALNDASVTEVEIKVILCVLQYLMKIQNAQVIATVVCLYRRW